MKFAPSENSTHTTLICMPLETHTIMDRYLLCQINNCDLCRNSIANDNKKTHSEYIMWLTFGALLLINSTKYPFMSPVNYRLYLQNTARSNGNFLIEVILM